MISNRMKTSLEASISIRDIFEEGKKLAEIHGKENIFNFSIGNPSVPPPEIVNNAIKETVDTTDAMTLHGYPSNIGHPDVRATIAKHLNTNFGMHYDENNILMTSGAAAAMAMICNSLLDIDDEVITFSPYFWEYTNYVGSFYGKLIPAACNQKTLQPEREPFSKAFSEKTRFVIVNSPNNPTGAVYNEESVRMIAEVMEEKQKQYGHPIYLVSDEVYRKLTYDGLTVPYLPHYYKNTLFVYSYSKTLSIPGERIGYIALSNEVDAFESLVPALTLSIRFLGYVNAPSLQQKILLSCVDATSDMSDYQKNRDLLYNSLTAMGYECIHPDGAFYLFFRSLEEDDVKFCQEAKKDFLLLAPGSAFDGPGFVRLSYCVPYDVIKRSLPHFENLMRRYKK